MMKRFAAGMILLVGFVLLAARPGLAQLDYLNQGKALLDSAASATQGSGASSSSLGTGLSADEIGRGLKEALRVGTQRTVSHLGTPGGFLNDQVAHIPLPGSLERVKSVLSLAGKLGLTDDLEGRLNKAAELATPKAAAIFGNAISRMSISDAKGILTGPQDSATQYFRRTTTDQLKSAFRPIVDKSLSDVGAVQALKGVTNEAGALGSGLDLDMTSYVMDKALEAIFHYVGAEEAAIRQNPAQRSTDLLKKVFQ